MTRRNHALIPRMTLALACRLLQSRRFPSWGYEIENGATSIWERWNSFTKDEGFMVGMNSFSHYSFGAVCEWMFTNLAGIENQSPSFGKILIRPMPPAAGGNPEQEVTDWVRADYDSVRGRISSHWANTSDSFTLETTLPANTDALVFLPADRADQVTEGGKSLAEVEGLQVIGKATAGLVLWVGSGSYRFEVGKK